VLAGEQKSIEAIELFPGGERLAAAGGNGRVIIWDLATRQEVLTLVAS
jgi:hypothetical protein